MVVLGMLLCMPQLHNASASVSPPGINRFIKTLQYWDAIFPRGQSFTLGSPSLGH